MEYKYGSHMAFQIEYHPCMGDEVRYKVLNGEVAERYWGRHFWARRYFCATEGQMTEEMIKQNLEYHFEPKANDDLRWNPNRIPRSGDAYPDFQSATQTHRL